MRFIDNSYENLSQQYKYEFLFYEVSIINIFCFLLRCNHEHRYIGLKQERLAKEGELVIAVDDFRV